MVMYEKSTYGKLAEVRVVCRVVDVCLSIFSASTDTLGTK